MAITLFSVPAHAQTQIQWTVLIIHGRFDPASGCAPEQYGTFTTDQACAWNAGTPTTTGTVKYVNWDAWNSSFDSTTWPGGEAVVHAAVFANCNITTNQYCSVICHSAGCAAFENFVAVTSAPNVINAVVNVIAAGSAAGGSELANDESSIPSSIQGLYQAIFGEGTFAPLDKFITTSYARSAYNHNNMQAIPIRALAGTGGKNGVEGDLEIFPTQSNSGSNPDCQTVLFNTLSMCSDTAVALHSGCGHNRVASFQDCNSTLTPFTDTAGTYNFHGWWIADRDLNTFNGPFSTMGKQGYNSSFHTYNYSHTQLKQLATQEYSACQTVVGTSEFYCR